MRNLKRITALFLSFAITLALSLTAGAADGNTGFTDVAADAWYADAVEYVRSSGLMNGTSATTFSPNSTMTRAMLATVLYRAEGSPAVTASADFRDVTADAYYADAVAWASESGVVSGYGNGMFGSNDPVTREQIAVILWRYEGSPAPLGESVPYADQASISSYAVTAVAWARENGIINGMSGNRFAPSEHATRAQVATILRNDLQGVTPDPTPTPDPDEDGGILVAYFSRTGNTEEMAELIAQQVNGTLFEILPATSYPDDYQATVSRHQEERRTDARPAIANQVDNMDGYDVVFLGFPIWSGDAPMIIRTFMESYDLSGKTVVPFATSGGSGIGTAQSTVTSFCPNSTVLDGLCVSGGNMESRVNAWLDGLNLSAALNLNAV